MDDEGNQYLLMNEITDQRKDNADITISDGMTRDATASEDAVA